MAFSTDDLEALRRDLTQLPPARPKSVSNRDAIGALTAELAAAQRLGYSVDELAELLSSKGLRITAGTLKGYLQQARKKKRSNKRGAATGSSTATGAEGANPPAAATTAPAPAPSSPGAPAPKPAQSGATDPRPADPAIGKGTAPAPSLPPPTPRRP